MFCKEKLSPTAHASEQLGQPEPLPSPAPHSHTPKSISALLPPVSTLPPPPQKKKSWKKDSSSKQNETGSWQNNYPEVPSQAQHPHCKQNHPVTTGSLATRRKKGGGCSPASSIWNLQARPGLHSTLPCSRKTGDSLSYDQQYRGCLGGKSRLTGS